MTMSTSRSSAMLASGMTFALALAFTLCQSNGDSRFASASDETRAQQTRDDAPTRETVAAGLRKAVDFYRREAGYQGAYLYRYSADL
ncbi:MAG TPA: hypothetical protein PLV92_17260, partial [Pirellulaceae bacterium]|nr:hypothetical protein [Pirellulaceae bacterium]